MELIDLPIEIFENIMSNLNLDELMIFSSVSSYINFLTLERLEKEKLKLQVKTNECIKILNKNKYISLLIRGNVNYIAKRLPIFQCRINEHLRLTEHSRLKGFYAADDPDAFIDFELSSKDKENILMFFSSPIINTDSKIYSRSKPEDYGKEVISHDDLYSIVFYFLRYNVVNRILDWI